MTEQLDTSAAAIAALLGGVTPGPWATFISDAGDKWTGWPISINCDAIDDKTIVRTGGLWPYEWDAKTSQYEACANARFIAAARDLVPALSAELTALRAEREKWRKTAISKIEMVGSTAIDAITAERDAALARVEVLEAALHTISSDIQINSDGEEELSDAAQIAVTAIAKGETL